MGFVKVNQLGKATEIEQVGWLIPHFMGNNYVPIKCSSGNEDQLFELIFNLIDMKYNAYK